MGGGGGVNTRGRRLHVKHVGAPLIKVADFFGLRELSNWVKDRPAYCALTVWQTLTCPKGPKHLPRAKYGFRSRNFPPDTLGRYFLYGQDAWVSKLTQPHGTLTSKQRNGRNSCLIALVTGVSRERRNGFCSIVAPIVYVNPYQCSSFDFPFPFVAP